MKTFDVYGYAGEHQQVLARSARRAAAKADFAVADVVLDGESLTPDCWA